MYIYTMIYFFLVTIWITQNPHRVQAMQNPNMPFMPNRSSMTPLTRLATMPLAVPLCPYV